MKRKKTVYWIIWSLVFIVINMGAYPIAAFSLFGTQEGTSIFSLDYLIAFSILALSNIITIQLFISLRKQDQKGFLYGLIIAIIEACALALFILYPSGFTISIALAAISIVGAVVLLIKSIIR